MYYLRSKPSIDAIKFTLEPKLMNKDSTTEEQECQSCSA
jgi:hypothetical protein